MSCTLAKTVVTAMSFKNFLLLVLVTANESLVIPVEDEFTHPILINGSRSWIDEDFLNPFTINSTICNQGDVICATPVPSCLTTGHGHHHCESLIIGRHNDGKIYWTVFVKMTEFNFEFAAVVEGNKNFNYTNILSIKHTNESIMANYDDQVYNVSLYHTDTYQVATAITNTTIIYHRNANDCGSFLELDLLDGPFAIQSSMSKSSSGSTYSFNHVSFDKSGKQRSNNTMTWNKVCPDPKGFQVHHVSLISFSDTPPFVFIG